MWECSCCKGRHAKLMGWTLPAASLLVTATATQPAGLGYAPYHCRQPPRPPPHQDVLPVLPLHPLHLDGARRPVCAPGCLPRPRAVPWG